MSDNVKTVQSILPVGDKEYIYHSIGSIANSDRLPYSLKVLLENVLRTVSDAKRSAQYAERIVSAGVKGETGGEVEFSPARVLFQDFTGVPVFVDFAVMREACKELGGDPRTINPQVPCDLVIDHSVIADQYASQMACNTNMQLEFERNQERYSFLKWAQDSFDNVRIVPPGQGICHQLNIEVFSTVVRARASRAASKSDASASHAASTSDASSEGTPHIPSSDSYSGDTPCSEEGGRPVAYFDTVVGTDSHTPTANGIGVLGWGVGGIEAEAAALGQPITTLVPKVVGVRLTGQLQSGVEGMDVALTFAEMLRAHGVVGCFVECFGPALAQLSATQRSCISNMTPEYGSTCTLFPIDNRTLEFLRMTGRSDDQVKLVEAYAKVQGLWHDENEQRVYAHVIELDLSTVQPSMAGPSRPHDRCALSDAYDRFQSLCAERSIDPAVVVPVTSDTQLSAAQLSDAQSSDAQSWEVKAGTIAIAAVTSCTTATDPHMMLACGLLAKKAHQAGLHPAPWVKTIFAPGSHATQLLLQRAGLLDSLDALGFATCGFGCMSCIGNSGAIHPALAAVADKVELASVLSGNRNFEGRISPDVSQNYLMTPAAVVAYALAGTVNIDIQNDPLGIGKDGTAVYLRDLWPTAQEIDAYVDQFVIADVYSQGAQGLFEGDDAWQSLSSHSSDIFNWDESSTYVRRAPYFEGMSLQPETTILPEHMPVLAYLGDFITTDHISPAGFIAPDSPAARYLIDHGVATSDFNTYGSRRGNHEVMMRGTFANVKLANKLAEGKKGGWTFDFVHDDLATIYDASCAYAAKHVPSVVLAGKMYGSGSSRDWAAKGPLLLGVRVVIAESYERIHRSNLIGMGILPLQFLDGESAESLGLTGQETFSVEPISFTDGIPDPLCVNVAAYDSDGRATEFKATVRIDTPTEAHYYCNGGILQYVIRKLVAETR